MSERKRLVIITSGGDWYDAGFETLYVAPSFNQGERRREYDAWLRRLFELKAAGAKTEYLSYTEWLRREGHAIAADVETYDEHDYE